MDLPHNFFYMLTPILVIITYLSAYKNGKAVCNRYLVNCLLYLITSFSIYLSSRQFTKDNIVINTSHVALLSISTLFMIIALVYSKNIITKHILWLLIIIILGIVGRYSKKLNQLNEETIQDILKKMMVILIICVSFAVLFPQYIKPSMGFALFIGLLFVILFRIIDTIFLKKKYDNYIMIDDDSWFKEKINFDIFEKMRESNKLCATGYTWNYIHNNVLDMF